MANLFLNLPVTPGDGVGAPVNTAAMGGEKTFTIQDVFSGSVTIEISEDGATWAQITTLTQTGKRVLTFASQFVRIRRTGVNISSFGIPNVDVSANDNGALFVVLPSAGTSVDTSALGNKKTIIVQGLPPGGTINIQVSDDNTRWATCMTFKASDVGFKDFTAKYMRSMGSSAIISVGAINDTGAADQDELVKASAADTTAGYLDQKLVAGSGAALAILNPGADEDVEISVSGADASNITTGPPITVRGATNAEGVGTPIARADHDHRLELEVEDEGALAGARPRLNFIGVGVGAVDDVPNDRINITIPGNTPSDGATVERSTYVSAVAMTAGSVFVDGMSGLSVAVPIDGNYWATWEGEFTNDSASTVLEVGVSVNSLVAVVPNSERSTQGNASDLGAFITSIELGPLLTGDLVRGLFRKSSGSPPSNVSLIRRNLTIFKVQ